MRVNIYAEEMTQQVELVTKEVDGHPFVAVRFYLHLPVTLPSGVQAKGPFIHRPGDDDSSAVTFWGKRDLRPTLRKALALLDAHYGDRVVETDTDPMDRLGGDTVGIAERASVPATESTAPKMVEATDLYDERFEGITNGIDKSPPYF